MQKRTRKNSKPEAMIQNQILFELFNLRIFAWVVDSKARYSPGLKRYARTEIPLGHPDIIGVDSKGRFIAVECKAPGKITNVRLFQQDFLQRIRDKGGFAVVADSPDLVRSLYLEWSAKAAQG
jgi:hypothetical protein